MKKLNFKILIVALAVCMQGFSAVIINEIAAATSDRNLNYSNEGYPTLGSDIPWTDVNFDDSTWDSGAGGLGFGVPGLATTVDIQGKAITFYVRQTFIVSAAEAAKADDLRLHIEYDDGFIAFVNGKEIARKNMGPKDAFGFHDQISYNGIFAGYSKDLYSSKASDFLVEGTNVIAIQVHNNNINNPGMSIIADLFINSSPEIQLVNHSDNWTYFVGLAEPSGGIFDPRLINPNVDLVATEWRNTDFDDSLWSQGPGGLGYGDDDDATIVNIRNVAFSLYIRQTFIASATTSDLTFTVDYDDAFVAYLNGHEIARRGLGAVGEDIPHNYSAPGLHEAGTPEIITLTNAGQYLIEGENVLAVQTHNYGIGSSDMTIKADLSVAGSADKLVDHTDIWHYFIGTKEPSETPGTSDTDEISDDFVDWIELYNNGISAVSLNGWALTDDSSNHDKWTFPNVSIDAGEYLVVLCSGESVKSSTGTYLQTSFKLSKEGEFLALFDNSFPRNFMSGFSPTYPMQDFFHTYGWCQASNTYLYYSNSTPGKPNEGETFSGVVADPVIDKNGGFFTNQISVAMSSATSNAEIRFTTTHIEPTENSGLYSNPLTISYTMIIRAKAFKAGMIPSKTITRSFLYSNYDFVKNVPVVSIVGDPGKSLFKPNGITSIVGGGWYGDHNLWSPTMADDYNIPMPHGRPYERPVSIEFIDDNTKSWKQQDCGLRIAGAGRHQYQLQDLSGRWDEWTYINKPQFNIFFRSDYGEGTLDFPLIPDSRVDDFDSLRLRSGKNDWKNPFIADEFARRMAINTGQEGSKGFLIWLYVNGDRKAYYNLVERYDEKFYQENYNSNKEWDIINQDWYMIGHHEIREGDDIEWNKFLAYMNTHNLADLNEYVVATQQIDVVDFIDYLIVQTYSGNWDWPNNNWYTARERSSNGVFRFYIWDAEGACATPIDTDNFNEYPPWRPGGGYGLNGEDCPIAQIYRSLKSTPEFRLLYADRAQKHYFNNGSMMEANLTETWEKLAVKMRVMYDSFFGGALSERAKNVWIPQRRYYVFQQLSNENLWPDTKAPDFNQHGGVFDPGFNVVINNPNSAGTVYYTTDGTDPRQLGGNIIGTEYSSPVTLTKTTQIKARVYNFGEFSPICEATFSVTGVPGIVVSEMMYHPPGGEDFEFIELKNISGDTLDISDVAFVDGITFAFADSAVTELQNEGYVVVVKSNAAFASIYNTNDILIAGEYEGKLANSGERIELKGTAGETLLAYTYSDLWYPTTDGDGYSLVIANANQSTNLWNFKEGWRPSLQINGSPGKEDIPEPVSIYYLSFIIYYLLKRKI